ncbi:MAG: DUF4956 domain-containing protein [Erysipelotrichaceae bacterium]|jgi:uncharacterized membrane protein YhiD involved in acid resistance|nr:DUF4956 domain-containing protein [Bacillota bacterium]NLP22878.1 DUF4956 domain-containing protein [Erysipelotrichaceae bacterium]
MSFSDVFKSSFLENFNSVSLFDMGLVLLLSFAIGLFIFYVYKRTYSGVMFSSSFGVTLIALSMITAVLILAVTSNVVLSLGMVGALSIVRFRTAIKEPSDIAFLFWSIAVGIILAAGLIPLALFGSLLIGAVLVYFSSNDTFNQPYILVLHCNNSDIEKETFDYIKANVEKLSLKSKSVSKDLIELNYEVRLNSSNTEFINTLSDMDGVSHVVMVSYNGDYMS